MAGGLLAFEGRSVSTTDLQAKGSHVSIAGIDTVQLDATHLSSGSQAVITGRDVTLGKDTAFSAPGTIRIRADRKFTNATTLDDPSIQLEIAASLENNKDGVIARDDLLLNFAGDIWNAGLLYGRNSASLSARNITNTETGAVYGGQTTLSAQGDLNNRGTILSDGALGIAAKGAVTNDGALKSNDRLTLRAASYKGGGDSTLEAAEADLKVAGAFENSGRILGRDRLTLSAQTLANMAGAELRSGANATIALAGDLFNAGQIGAVGDLTITGAHAGGNAGQIVSQDGSLRLEASGIVGSSGTISASEDLVLTAAGYQGLTDSTLLEGGSISVDLGAGAFANAGRVTSSGKFDLTAGRFLQTASAVSQGRQVRLRLNGEASNAGAIYASGDFSLNAPSLLNTGQILANGQTTIAVRVYVSNSGLIISGNDLSLTAAFLANDGSILASGSGILALGDGAFINNGEARFAGGLKLTAGLYDGGTASRLEAGGSLDAAITGSFTNAGNVQSAQALTLDVKGALANSGSLLGQTLALRVGANLTNAGLIGAFDALTATVAGRVDSAGSLVASDGPLTLSAGGLVSSSGDIIAKGRLVLAAAYETPAATGRLGGGDVVVRLGSGHLFNLGQLVAVSGLDVEAGEFGNGPEGRVSGAAVRLALAGAADNRGGIESTGDLTVVAPSLANAGSILANATGSLQVADAVANSGRIVGQDLALRVGADLANTSLIGAFGSLAINVGGRVDNTGSLLAQGGDLTLTAGGLTSSGDIIAKGRLALTAAAYETRSNTARLGGGDVVVRLGSGRLFNLGQLVAANSLDAEAGDFGSGPDGRISGATVRLALAGAADNRGLIETTGDLALSAASLANPGTILSNGKLALQLAGAFNNGGRLVSRSITLRVGTDLGNSGLIGALEGLSIAASGRVANTGSLLAQGGDFDLTAGSLVSSSGDIIAKGRLALTAAAYETSSNAARLGGGDVIVRLGPGHLLNLGQIVANGLDAEAGDFGNGPDGRVAVATMRLALTGAADNRGLIESTGDLALSAASLANSGSILANEASSLQVAGAASNGGRLIGRSLALRTGADLSNSGLIGTLDSLAVTVGGGVDNAGSLIAQGGDLTLTASGIVSSSGDIIAKGRLALTASAYDTLANAARLGRTDVVVRLGSGRLFNLGQLAAANSLEAVAGGFGNGPEGHVSGATVRLALTGAADYKGHIESTGDLAFSAASLANGGSILADGASNFEIAGATSNGGNLISRSLALRTGAGLGNSGLIGALEGLSISAGGQVDNTGSLLVQDGDLTLAAGGIVSSSGDIIAKDRLALTASGYETPAATARMGGTVVVVRLGAGRLFNLGQLAAANGLDAEAGDSGNGPDGRVSGATVRLALTGAADNKGRIESTGDLAFSAGSLANAGAIAANGVGTLQIANALTSSGRVVAQSLAVKAGGGLANAGLIGSLTALSIEAGGRVDNAGSLVAQGGDLSLTAGGGVSSSGDIIAKSRLALTAGGYETPVASARLGGTDIVVRLGSGHLMNLGQLVAANGLDAEAGDFGNGPDGRISGATVRLALTGAAGNKGRIESTGDLAFSALSLANSGSILSNRLESFQIAGSFANSGRILGPSPTLRVGGDFANSGVVGAITDLSVEAGGRVDNAGSLIAQGGNVILIAAGVVSSSGDIIAKNRLALTAAGYETPAASARMGGTNVVVRLGSGRLFNLGQLVAANSLDAEAGDFGNGPDGRISGATVRLALTGAAANQGHIESTGDLAFSAGKLANNGAILTNGAGSFQIGGLLSNSGRLSISGDATVKAGSYDGGADGVLSARNLKLDVDNALANSGAISAAGLVNVKAGSLENRGTGTIAGDATNLVVTGDARNAGTLTAKNFLGGRIGGGLQNDGTVKAQDVALQIGQSLVNRGALTASGTLAASAGTLENGAGGRIEANLVSLAVSGDARNAGTISAADTLILQAANLQNAGSGDQIATLSARILVLSVGGALSNGPSALISGSEPRLYPGRDLEPRPVRCQRRRQGQVRVRG
ncbi:hypothetical protein ACRAWG_15520 [Methylobacterium sp. P31]